MNHKLKAFLKNFGFTLSSNVVTLLVATTVTLIIPKVIGVEQYGYFQLYVFYSNYLFFFQFGWNDGVYLKYGGAEYGKLDKPRLFSQFWVLVATQIAVSFGFVLYGLFGLDDANRQFICWMLAIVLVASGTRTMILLLFQATNRFSDFSKSMILDRLLYFLLVVALLVFGVDYFQYIVVADVIGKVVATGYTIYLAKDLVFLRPSAYRLEVHEIYDNIRIGINLMFANMAGMLILGVVRFGVERSWDVETFSKVSLTLNISTMLMVFVNAMSAILFPLLRRVTHDSLPKFYVLLRDMLMPLLLGFLFLYFPLNVLLSAWLPEYKESIEYMFLILSIVVFEGKVTLLINTYLKTLRQEKLMFKVNLLSVVISLTLTLVTAFYLKNLYLTMFVIFFVLAFRCVVAEVLLAKMLNLRLWADIGKELLMTLTFMCLVFYLTTMEAALGYLVLYVLYLVTKKRDFVNAKYGVRALLADGR